MEQPDGEFLLLSQDCFPGLCHQPRSESAALTFGNIPELQDISALFPFLMYANFGFTFTYPQQVMAAHGLLCQLSLSYSWEKLQFGSAGPEHSIFTSTIKSSLLQMPLLTLLHFILCCHLMKSSMSCKNLILFYVRVQISI